MEAEYVLQLLDSYWYDLEIFKRSSKPTKNQPYPEISTPKISADIPILPTIQTKSPADDQMSSTSSKVCISSTTSPDSVLFTSKLQKIFSGKESVDFDAEDHEQQETPKMVTSRKDNIEIQRRRKKRGFSKSLSDLEFEELKGFMDLGFVFSEEDKDSSLATIIPGLQRLGNNNVGKKINDGITTSERKISGSVTDISTMVARPYLSETWQVLEKKKKENDLMKWKVPAHNSQIDMKDYLKSWAHTVASTVR